MQFAKERTRTRYAVHLRTGERRAEKSHPWLHPDVEDGLLAYKPHPTEDRRKETRFHAPPRIKK